MTNVAVQPWEAKRTEETRYVESYLMDAGFDRVDAYRYNSAAIRVRVIDPRFEGRTPDERDAMVEDHLRHLAERTQADILTLLTFSPSEIEPSLKMTKHHMNNLEFEDPSLSML